MIAPNTSGGAQWTNYCKWTVGTNKVLLGEWSAHQTSMTIISNPFNRIDANTKHAIMNTTTSPAIAPGIMELVLTHKKISTSPIEPDALKLSVYPLHPKLTLMSILAEDGGDQNYLDFQLTIVIGTS